MSGYDYESEMKRVEMVEGFLPAPPDDTIVPTGTFDLVFLAVRDCILDERALKWDVAPKDVMDEVLKIVREREVPLQHPVVLRAWRQGLKPLLRPLR